MDSEVAENARTTRHSAGFDGVSDGPVLVLGGGGLKGLAHVGAWRALHEAGMTPSVIIGTSIGAFVGALISAGMTPEESLREAQSLEKSDIVQVNRRTVFINGIRQTSVFRAEPLREYYQGLLPSGGWDDLRVPLTVNAVDLATGRTEWFGAGGRTDLSLADAVYASSALPVFYPPFKKGRRWYIDGGTQDPLPIAKAADDGAKRIVAVDVGAGADADADATVAHGILGVHQRVFAILTHRIRQEAFDRWDGPPLLYVRPRLEGYGPFDFDSVEYFLEEGYRAASAALEAVRG